MSREYRFQRLNADMEPVEEIVLRCIDDEDALILAGRLGRRIEVYEGDRRLTVVLSGVREPIPEALPEVQAGAEAAPEPAAEPPPEDLLRNIPKAFNPFRQGVWRRSR